MNITFFKPFTLVSTYSCKVAPIDIFESNTERSNKNTEQHFFGTPVHNLICKFHQQIDKCCNIIGAVYKPIYTYRQE